MHAIRDDSVPAVEPSAIRKVALRLVPFVASVFVINFLDQTAISFAGPNGLTRDLSMTAAQFGLYQVESGYRFATPLPAGWDGQRECAAIAAAQNGGLKSAGRGGDEMTYYREDEKTRKQGRRIVRGTMNRIYLVAAGLMLSTLPAIAGVREDIVAAIQRCSVIQDDKVWLDCAYGAQQPMRTKLGLMPAPEFQQRLVPPAYPTSVAAAPPPMREAAHLPRRKDGLMSMFGDSGALVISALVGVRYDGKGAFIVTLENGQVWHQVNMVEGAPKVRLTLGAKVRILRGAVWSYDLKADNNPHAYKVNREA